MLRRRVSPLIIPTTVVVMKVVLIVTVPLRVKIVVVQVLVAVATIGAPKEGAR